MNIDNAWALPNEWLTVEYRAPTYKESDMKTVCYYILMAPVIVAQLPFWAWAKLRNKKYIWLGGPQ